MESSLWNKGLETGTRPSTAAGGRVYFGGIISQKGGITHAHTESVSMTDSYIYMEQCQHN